MAEWQTLNYDEIPDLTTAFTLTTKAGTDIYDKPPDTHRFDSPIVYKTSTVSEFKSLAVTVEAEWKELYDQGGLIIIVELEHGVRKWIKSGIEYVDGTPMFSVVSKDRWADWSLRPVSQPGDTRARLKFETHEDGALWVYLLDKDGSKRPVREITWWGEFQKDVVIKVGVFCAKPTGQEELQVHFSDLEVGIEGESI